MRPQSHLLASAILGACAVSLGAFGAHALRDALSPGQMAIYHTATQYHFWHTLALALVGVLRLRKDSKQLLWSGHAFLVGTIIFSGTLYLLAVVGWRWLGAITPIGGVLYILGWCLLAASCIGKR